MIFDSGDLKTVFMRKIRWYRVCMICEHNKNVTQFRIGIKRVDFDNIRPLSHYRDVLCDDG